MTEVTGTGESQTTTTETTTTGNTPAGAPATTTTAPVIDPKIGDGTTSQQQPATQQATAGNATEAVSYEPTGDAGLDVALGFVGKLGIASDHPAMKATACGDFSLIKAHLATMGDKAQGWEQMVALAEQAYSRNEQSRKATETAVSNAVISVAGSAEQWSAIKDWASKNATPDEKSAINAMFDAGPVQARAAAIMLRDLHSKAAGTVVNPASAVKAGASAGQTSNTSGPLSPRDYSAEVRKLHGQLGNRMESSPQYAALRARHAAYRG